MGAQLPARWPDRSERLSSMPKDTMDRLEGAVAGQLQRRLGGWWLGGRPSGVKDQPARSA